MTNIEIIGFILELMTFGVAICLYLYTAGILASKDRSKQKQQNEFINQHGRWLRPLSLALMAIMAVNIGLRLFCN